MIYKSLLLCLVSTNLFISSICADELMMFTPPKGWRMAEKSTLPSSVKLMVVGKGDYDYPPSMNLATEKFGGSLKDYLKIIKNLNATHGAEWKDLGKINTEAGNASLSQVDLKNEWGDIRMMHVILVKSGTAYILTAASRKEEFPNFYKEFFTALKSLRTEKEPVEETSHQLQSSTTY